MWIKSIKIVVGTLLISTCCNAFGSSDAWNNYWDQYGHLYDDTGVSKVVRRINYNSNSNAIRTHNFWFKRGLRTFELRENQYSAMSTREFGRHFPPAQQPSSSFDSTPPDVPAPPFSYDPLAVGLVLTVQDQGLACNSGWAYATAKAIEIMQAYLTGDLTTQVLSAQNLIDCAGGFEACTRQVPQVAFDFMTQYNQKLHLAENYPNNNSRPQQGQCISPTDPMQQTTNLTQYAKLAEGNDELMKSYIAAGYPVVVEVNPTTFEFMHYGGGVFTQRATRRGSHFMSVIGYGAGNNSDSEYWTAINSFGTTWGENGYMRIARNSTRLFVGSGIFPIE